VTAIEVIEGDIARLEVDAIVNAANSSPVSMPRWRRFTAPPWCGSDRNLHRLLMLTGHGFATKLMGA
jgi:hypothetical protein